MTMFISGIRECENFCSSAGYEAEGDIYRVQLGKLFLNGKHVIIMKKNKPFPVSPALFNRERLVCLDR